MPSTILSQLIKKIILPSTILGQLIKNYIVAFLICLEKFQYGKHNFVTQHPNTHASSVLDLAIVTHLLLLLLLHQIPQSPAVAAVQDFQTLAGQIAWPVNQMTGQQSKQNYNRNISAF